MNSGNGQKETRSNLSKVTSPGVTRIFKSNRRETAGIGDAFTAENKITDRLTAKRLSPLTIARKSLATNASGTIVPEANTELMIARAVPCARFVREDITRPSATVLMTATTMERPTVIYPVVVVEVLGVKCRALLVGSSYASAALLDRLKIRPHQREVRQVEMMMGVVTKPVEIFKVQISSLKGDFLLETDVTLVKKRQLLSLENPRYQQVLERYDHLKGVKMDDMDTKEFLPVHLILGVCDYTKIKTETAPLIGATNEPIAEKTKFGWTIISPGKEVDLSPMFLTQTSTADYDNLCRLDVLGLADCATGDQEEVYSEFKEQLRRDEEGWYETSFPWKGNHPPLPSNEAGSLRRLTGLVTKER